MNAEPAEPIEHRFTGGSLIRSWPSRRYLETHFPDSLQTGLYCPAQANDTPEDKARAAVLGYDEYQDPTWGLTCGHEVAHTVLAEYYGWLFSPVLRRASNGTSDERLDHKEESTVLALQRLSMTKFYDPVLETLGVSDAVGMALDVRRISEKLMGL